MFIDFEGSSKHRWPHPKCGTVPLQQVWLAGGTDGNRRSGRTTLRNIIVSTRFAKICNEKLKVGMLRVL